MSLDAAREAILADLQNTQGPWRQRPAALRVTSLLVPLLVVVGAAFFGLSWHRGLSLQVVAALLSSVIALVGIVLAPERPGLSERFSQIAVVVAVVAFAAELSRMDRTPMGSTLGCLATTGGVTVVAAAVVAFALFASRLPLRLWHRIGIATASTLGACGAVWNHCPSTEVGHVIVGHALGPAVVLGVIVVVVGLARRDP